LTASFTPRVRAIFSIRYRAASAASASPAGTRTAVPGPTTNVPCPGTTSAGRGIRGSGVSAKQRPVASNASAARMSAPRRIAARASELGSHREIVLRSILVEGPRLVFVQRIVLERRVVQVLAVEAEREHVVQRVLQRGRQVADLVLREGG